jgi:hypothetical protein
MEGQERGKKKTVKTVMRKAFKSVKPVKPVKPAAISIDNQIRQALAGMGSRVRLADLRARLPHIPRAQMDRVLYNLQAQGEIMLYPMDDPRERTKADNAAAIDIAGVGKRHLIIRIK